MRGTTLQRVRRPQVRPTRRGRRTPGASTPTMHTSVTVLRMRLLPPRHEDNVTGEVRLRYWASLTRSMAQGEYEPTRAVRIPVPKPGYTTRPAALLTLDDRVVLGPTPASPAVNPQSSGVEPVGTDGQPC